MHLSIANVALSLLTAAPHTFGVVLTILPILLICLKLMKKNMRASGNMRNIYLFLKWCAVHSVRWVMTGPYRLHNACIKEIEDRHTEVSDILLLFVLLGLCVGSGISTLLSFAIFHICKAFGVHMSNLAGGLIIAMPAMFLSTVAVRALFRKFRREQEEIFETLKGDYRA